VLLQQQARRVFGLSVYTKFPPALPAILALLIGAGVVALYIFAAFVRHEANPSDKILPTLPQLAGGIMRAVTPDRNGDIPLLIDTFASLKRLFLGVIIGSVIGIGVGLHMGLFPFVEALLLRSVQFVSKVPPLALLPIVFIAAGLGEFAKVLLIVIGLFPAILISVYFQTKSIQREQYVKELTFGGSTYEVVSLALAQVMPYAFNAIRINLLTAWLFLIASESIAAEAGLGYRIFLVRRYLAMDTIIPYVLWIAFLSFAFDMLLGWWIKHRYPWYRG